MKMIPKSSVIFENLKLKGGHIQKTSRTLDDLNGYFHDVDALSNLDKNQTIYEVESYFPMEKGTEGGLFYGITTIHPGKVGREYHMTKGHFHKLRSRAEFYWGIEGEGALILMDENRKTWAEQMLSGSIHFISGRWAHRVCNTGDTPLIFGACWPADAGYNYDEILEKGFSSRVIEINSKPQLVNQSEL